MIQNYALSSKELHALLVKKEVKFLYHANTVFTSKTFITQGAMLSRAYVEKHELGQTLQYTDSHDKKHDVWDSIFLDGTDHHKKYKKPNSYGPVLFRIKLDLLLSDDFSEVYITRDNPSRWNDAMTLEQKYYDSLTEFDQDYLTGKKNDSQLMFTFRSKEKSLSLHKYLHSIGLDGPNINLNTNKGNMSAKTYIERVIRKALEGNGMQSVPIIVRHQKVWERCNCHTIYSYMFQNNKVEFIKRFGSTV